MDQQSLSKQERRELKRRMKAANRAASGKKQKLSSVLWLAFFVIILGGLFAYVLWDIMRPLAGISQEIMAERTHVQDGEHPAYLSEIPTSGQHYANPEEWGVYDKPLTKERLVHNLEHGGIVMYYNCKQLEKNRCENLTQSLKDLAGRLAQKDHKVILVPNDEIDDTIMLTAWGWYDTMHVVDEDKIWKFFNDHINTGPERVP